MLRLRVVRTGIWSPTCRTNVHLPKSHPGLLNKRCIGDHDCISSSAAALGSSGGACVTITAVTYPGSPSRRDGLAYVPVNTLDAFPQPNPANVTFSRFYQKVSGVECTILAESEFAIMEWTLTRRSLCVLHMVWDSHLTVWPGAKPMSDLPTDDSTDTPQSVL